MYVSIAEWRDLTDGHLYREGEPFPFDGREIPKERLEQLESGRNGAGLRLIKACEPKAGQAEAPKQKAPEKAPEGRKTAPRKKTRK